MSDDNKYEFGAGVCNVIHASLPDKQLFHIAHNRVQTGQWMPDGLLNAFEDELSFDEIIVLINEEILYYRNMFEGMKNPVSDMAKRTWLDFLAAYVLHKLDINKVAARKQPNTANSEKPKLQLSDTSLLLIAYDRFDRKLWVPFIINSVLTVGNHSESVKIEAIKKAIMHTREVAALNKQEDAIVTSNRKDFLFAYRDWQPEVATTSIPDDSIPQGVKLHASRPKPTAHLPTQLHVHACRFKRYSASEWETGASVNERADVIIDVNGEIVDPVYSYTCAMYKGSFTIYN